MSARRPDRPIAGWARPLRTVIRRARHALIQARLGSRLQAGAGVIIGARCVLLPPEFMRLGDNVALGREVHVETNLDVGSDVLISSRVAFVGNDHAFSDPTRTVFDQGRLPSQVVRLEGDNLIGFGTIVLGGVTIGRGCIVGAGAVVTSDLPPQTVCVGAPARPIRDRYVPDAPVDQRSSRAPA